MKKEWKNYCLNGGLVFGKRMSGRLGYLDSGPSSAIVLNLGKSFLSSNPQFIYTILKMCLD